MSNRTTLEQLQDFRPIFMDLAKRAERGRDNLGRILDGELRGPYQVAEKRMNSLLERYFAENAEVEFQLATGGVELPDVFMDIPIKHTHEVYESD